MTAMLDMQHQFTQAVASLLLYADTVGYKVSFGECYRTPEQAKLNAAKGSGIADSLHCERLAIDLNLFRDGNYITDGTGYDQLGAFWKSRGNAYRWGGDFTRRDYNHFSYSPDGVRG